MTLELARVLKFDPVPTIITEVVLANIGRATTLVGDPPNVILGTVLGFGFNDFLIHNGPVGLLAGGGALGVSFLMNKKSLESFDQGVDLKTIKEIIPFSPITDPYLLRYGLMGMGMMLIFLIGRPLFLRWHFPISIATASLLPAFIILTFGGPRVYRHNFIRWIDSETLVFFMGLFILIGALEERKIIQAGTYFLASLFDTQIGFLSSLFWGSAFVSGFVDNVPLALARSFIIKQAVANQFLPSLGIMVWTISLGVDLGGNLTPIGASANVVAYSYLERNRISMSWKCWFKLALLPTLTALFISYLALLFKFHWKFY